MNREEVLEIRQKIKGRYKRKGRKNSVYKEKLPGGNKIRPSLYIDADIWNKLRQVAPGVSPQTYAAMIIARFVEYAVLSDTEFFMKLREKLRYYDEEFYHRRRAFRLARKRLREEERMKKNAELAGMTLEEYKKKKKIPFIQLYSY